MELYPVTATIDGRRRQRCKLFVDGSGSELWRWDRQAGPVRLLATQATPVKSGRNSWTLAADGGEVGLVKEGGCGCGDRLKRWRPGNAPARTST